MRKILLTMVCALAAIGISTAAHAGGFGFYGTGGYSLNFGPSANGANAGGGILADTAVAKPGFEYRFNLAGEWWQDYYIHIAYEGGLLQHTERIYVNAGKVNFVHTFAFDVKSNKRFKFWIGPQIHHGIFIYEGFAGVSAGLGLAMGWNIHVNRVMSVIVDMAVRGGYLLRGLNGYLCNGGNVSFHANAGIVFRFNDQYRKK